MRVTETMGKVRGGSKKKAVKDPLISSLFNMYLFIHLLSLIYLTTMVLISTSHSVLRYSIKL